MRAQRGEKNVLLRAVKSTLVPANFQSGQMFRSNFCGQITNVVNFSLRIKNRLPSYVRSSSERRADVVVDVVAGEVFPSLFKVLKRGGRYVSAGAIGGPLVSFDTRTFYLKDLQLIGCTAWDEPVFPSLISYIENHQIKPLLAKTFPLEMIAKAQQEFLLKKHVGNFVLIPPKNV